LTQKNKEIAYVLKMRGFGKEICVVSLISEILQKEFMLLKKFHRKEKFLEENQYYV
jgi:hypothetical protein